MVEPVIIMFQGNDESREAFDKLMRNMEKTRKKSSSLMSKWRDLTVVATGLKRTFQFAAKHLGAFLDKTERSINAEAMLAVALRKSDGDIKTQMSNLKRYADEKERLTGITSELTLELAKIGAEFGIFGKDLERATSAVLDRATIQGRAPLDMMRILAKSVAGVTEGWVELGVVMDKSATRQAKLNSAIAQMNSGVSEMLGRMPTFKRFNAAWVSLQSNIGRVVANTGVFRSILAKTEGIVNRFNEALTDPKKMKSLAAWLDGIIFKVTLLGAAFIRVALKGVAMLIDAFISLLNTVNRVAKAMTHNDEKIAQASKMIEKYSEALKQGQTEMKGTEGKIIDVARELDRWTEKLNFLTGEVELNTDSLRDWGEQLLDAAINLKSVFGVARSAGTVTDMIAEWAEALRTKLVGGQDKMTQEMKDKWSAFHASVTEQFLEAGSGYAQVLVAGAQDLFDEDVTFSDAGKNFGRNFRDQLVGQMSGEAVRPLQDQMGRLAIAMAKPFQAVGNIIANIFAPLTNVIAGAIEFLVNKFLTVIGLQKLAAATGISGVAAIAATASGLAGVWGAAATAAAIATLGTATAFAVPAQAAITTGAATAKVLSVPGLAEGGMVLPRPGGTLAILAEKGEEEFVIPASKLPQFFGAAAGHSMSISFDGASFNVSGDDPGAAVNEMMMEFQQRLMETRSLGSLGPGPLSI